MTRTHTARPIWTWRCDECGIESGDLAFDSSGLPSYDDMRRRGWFIAEKWGDKCPKCKEATDD